MEKRNILYLEIMRIIAILLVIFNHTGERGFLIFVNCAYNSLGFWVCMALSVICKFAVPLFFIISGVLLLKDGKDESIVSIFKKRILRMLIVLVTFSFINYFRIYLFWTPAPKSLNFKDFFVTLYSNCHFFSYWYIYAYIAFLISLPFLRVLARNLKTTHFLYMIALFIFFQSILPVVEYIVFKGQYSLNGYARPDWLLNNVVFWPLLGYFLEYRLEIKNIKKLAVLMGGGEVFSV